MTHFFEEIMGKKGNLGWKLKRKCDKLCCKRITYKELKRFQLSLRLQSQLRKRITYKELKQARKVPLPKCSASKRITYKELKH